MHLHSQTLPPQHRWWMAPLLLAAGLLVASTPTAAADADADGAFVWAASKSGGAVVIRPGLALASPGNLRLGLESSLIAADATSDGTVAAPLAVWSEVDLPGQRATSIFRMRLDARSGAGRAMLRQSRSLSTASGVDMRIGSGLEAGQRANGRSAFIARQELTLDFPNLGTALAGSAVLDNATPVATSLKFEQKLPLGITLSATFPDLHAVPNPVFRAGISGRW